MIIRPRPTFFQLLFILRGSIVLRIAPQILFRNYAAYDRGTGGAGA